MWDRWPFEAFARQLLNIKKEHCYFSQLLFTMFGFSGDDVKPLSMDIFRPKSNKFKRRKIGEKPDSESESYQPDFHHIKKYGFPIKESRVLSGSWTLEENKLYLKFMEDNRTDFQTQKNRRRTKVFYRLSKVLKKRTPDQCRSHHQKLQIKYNDQLDRILDVVRQKIAEEMGIELLEGFNAKAQLPLKKTQATGQINQEEYSLIVSLAVDFGQLAVW